MKIVKIRLFASRFILLFYLSFSFQPVTVANSGPNQLAAVVKDPHPVISSLLSSTHASGSFDVVISGNNFINVQKVELYRTKNGSPGTCVAFKVNSPSRITVTANLAPGTYYFKTPGSNFSPKLVVTEPINLIPLAGNGYRLKLPLPAIVNDGTVSEGVSTYGYRTMWRGADNNVHLLACFGGDSNSGWFGHYINMNTGAHKMITGPSKGAAMWWTYNPAADRVYIATSYAQYHESLWEFNANDQSLVMVSPTADHYSSLNLITGDDNRVYWATQWNQLFSYDHATSTFKNYGTVLAGLQNGSNYFSLGADTGYVYCGVLKLDGTRTLVISPTNGTPNFTEWQFGNAGDKGLSISTKLGTHEWICTRTLADGSHKTYFLANGTYTDSGQATIQDEYHQDLTCRHCVIASDENSYPSFSKTYGWDCDFTDLLPIKSIHEFSTLRYHQVWTGANHTPINPLPPWKTATANFTGSWISQTICCVVPKFRHSVFMVTDGYNASLNLDYALKASAYLGANNLSPYAAMRHPSGEIYIGGYSNRVLRYDPTQPWSLTSATATPTVPSDPKRANPYPIKMPTPLLHYRHGLDYDADGVVWIGGNTTRDNPDYGNVMWYKPGDGTSGYLFPGWQKAGTKFANLCAASRRSRICVSDNLGNIWIINASTKTVDPTPIVPVAGGSKTYMIEVKNDLVFGIVISASGNKVIRFRPSTKEVLTIKDLEVSGTPFGFGDNQYSRMKYKLEMGPDGYVWMFVGDSLYRVDPNICGFTKVMDIPHAKLKFAPNNVDLLLYSINGTTDFKYIPGILEKISP